MTFDQSSFHDAPGRNSTDEQHALFAVVRYLDALQLGGCCHALMLWLGRYDGLGWHIAPTPGPMAQVRDLLAQYVARGESVCGSTMFDGITQLPFVQCRAALSREPWTIWNPLDIPFIEFSGDRHVKVWRDDTFTEKERLSTLAHLLHSYYQNQDSDKSRGGILR